MTRTPRAPRAGVFRIMALATGLAVATNYLAQPILDVLRDEFGLSATAAGMLVTAAQSGYAVGLVLLVPLADVLRRRPLACTLLLVTAAGLVLAGAAPSGSVLLAASVLAAVASVGAQVIVPYAAELAAPEDRAHVVGVVMSGLILGTIVGRTGSGVLTDLAGWRAPYFLLAALLVAIAAVLARALPAADPNPGSITFREYTALLRSMGVLVRRYPALRLRTAVAALSLGSFLVQAAAVTFLLAGPRYGWTASAIGLIGLLGAVGALSAAPIGRLVDRGLGAPLTWGGLVVQTAGWLVMIGADGRIGIPALVVGLVLIGVGQQAALNTSQAVVYVLEPAARGRINAVFMGGFFVGGTIGSAATAALWPLVGWFGVCLLGAGLAAAALVVFLAGGRRAAPGRE